MRARFYNPVIGRFTQEDVYRGDGLNLYGYCGSNPVGYCDPSGYKCASKQSAFGKVADEDLKRYNDHWDNVAAAEGMLPDYNRAIKKYDVFGDYYEAKLKYEKTFKWGTDIKEMDIDYFNNKAEKLKELSDNNQLSKTKSKRNQSITRSYKEYMKEDSVQKYKDNPTELKKAIKRVNKMDPDHIWELQLGGPDEWKNLKMAEMYTNRKIGINISAQLRNVAENGRIKIVIER
ncbi:RHS repeat-associated core domain-containing protein [Clostridium estertheticum]|uniref:RHS repeat-associated core domain-containing protein n=1 Tax=Clostridium estertheticum TaxID=238834 RepID=UPI000971535D|nr:RHS repeat-associated core domain-containing protein [Clostridium estertheticum]MBZ9617878.1 RHS repeat-associated core domain-containing protein [Clostridium estertheticum subsp. laramiense]WAG73541.1 RHS repeat-associated core domain-containing protein [Clostridium estertheticum]